MTLKTILTSWTSNFRAFSMKALSLHEGVRLALIVGSSLSIALAGQLAQSRNQDSLEPVINRVVAQAVSVKAPHTRPRAQTKFEKFAASQMQTFQELLDALTERAELVASMSDLSPADQARLQTSLKQFDTNLMAARESLQRLKTSTKTADPFLEDDLRSSIFALQESASQTQGEIISVDHIESQGFKVSRTGQ